MIQLDDTFSDEKRNYFPFLTRKSYLSRRIFGVRNVAPSSSQRAARNINRVPILKKHAPHCVHNGKCNLYKRKGQDAIVRGTRRFNALGTLQLQTYKYCSRLRHARCGTRLGRKLKRKLRCNKKDAPASHRDFILCLFYEGRSPLTLQMGLFRAPWKSVWERISIVDRRAFPHRLSRAQSVTRIVSEFRQPLPQLSRLQARDFVLSSQITGDGTILTLPHVICWPAQAAFRERISRRCAPLRIHLTLSR